MHCLHCRKHKHRFKKPMLKASVVLSKSMIVFVYSVCPTLMSTAILGELLRYTIIRYAHLCPLSSFIHVTLSKHGMCLQTNQVEWLFIAHVIFGIILTTRFKGFSACKEFEVWRPVSMMKLLRTKCISLEREKCPFCEVLENIQRHYDDTKTKIGKK